MSNAPLPELPSMSVHRQMQRFIDSSAKDPRLALDWLRQHPGLARTDEAWYTQFPESNPGLFDAIAYHSLPVVKAYLDAGSSASAHTLGAPDIAGSSALQYAILHITGMQSLEIVSHLARHPSCDLSITGKDGFPTVFFMMPSLSIPDDKKLETRSREVFLDLLERTPDETLVPQTPPFPSIPHAAHMLQDARSGAKLFVLRALVNRGLDPFADVLGDSHPMMQAFQEGDNALISAMLAAGMDEKRPVVSGSRLLSIQEMLESLIGRQDLEEIHFNAYEILKNELSRVQDGSVSCEHLLLTPAGRPTWQALGLARFGMLGEMFEHNNRDFMKLDEQLRVAALLQEALPEELKACINLPALQRDPAHGRPAHTALVRYMHGSDLVSSRGME